MQQVFSYASEFFRDLRPPISELMPDDKDEKHKQPEFLRARFRMFLGLSSLSLSMTIR